MPPSERLPNSFTHDTLGKVFVRRLFRAATVRERS